MDPTVTARPGVEGGFWAKAGPYRGYAKPLNPTKSNPHQFPIGAIEKIASDLAFKLHLPVAPVTLWERVSARSGEPKYHSVSAPPFAQVMTWGDIMRDPALVATIVPLAVGAMSAMLAFDTWVQCEDHANNHHGNLLLTTAASPVLTAWFAFIDYSFSMTHRWRTAASGGSGHSLPWVAPIYCPAVAPNVAVIREAVDAIEQVSDVTIQQIVGRVPDPFLSQADKSIIIDGLTYRRNHLRGFLGARYPGV